MTKNIAVIDEQGNRYEATYLKRAKGLVKNGRARFVDEKTICLACPPDKSEDKNMSENMNLDSLNSLKKQLEEDAVVYLGANRKDSGAEQDRQQDDTLNREIVKRILDQLEHFPADDGYFKALKEIEFDEDDGMVNIVLHRECTRQKQLELYKAILEKALDKESYAGINSDPLKRLEQITAWMTALNRNNFDEDMWEMIVSTAGVMLDRIVRSDTTDASPDKGRK